MLSEQKYLASLPLDPIALKQEWGLIRNNANQIIGVLSLSNGSPTLLSKLFSFRSGEKYSDWKFVVE